MMSLSARPDPWRPRRRSAAIEPIAIAGLVACAALVGILTRPGGLLASFWPANAILLGLMVRFPRHATVPNWIGAIAGFLLADLATGSSLARTIWLTSANMAEVLIGFSLFRLLGDDVRRLRGPLAVPWLVVISVCLACVAAIVGGGLAHLLFGNRLQRGMEVWFVSVLVNNLIILPVLLTIPAAPFAVFRRLLRRPPLSLARRLPPILAVLVSGCAGVLLGGPGAIVFPVPALLWCALSFGMFTTAILTMAVCAWLLVAASIGVVPLTSAEAARYSVTSIRLGVALMALGPLTVACINASRNELLAGLSHAVDHDALTGILSRGTFIQRGNALLSRMAGTGRPVAVLMLDIDHFKAINDRHGHPAGDRVLAGFVKVAGERLRQHDLFGRLGGEEFAVVLPDIGPDEAEAVARRIRLAVETAPMPADIGPGRITVSIGVAVAAHPQGDDLDRLLDRADSALYRAKAAGRNRVEIDRIT